MSRKKKDGKRNVGIQSRNGWLYITITQYSIEDGEKKKKKKWISTGLRDTPENIQVATQQRLTLLHCKANAPLDKNITVSDYVNNYLTQKKREVADTTYAGYLHRAAHIIKFYSQIKVKELNKELVEQFLDYLFTTEKLGPTTVDDTKRLFCTIIQQAVMDGLISTNPVKEAKISEKLATEYASTKIEDDEFFSYSEIQKFLSITENHNMYELFYVTLFFGLRRSEVLGLQWSAIDFSKKELSIAYTVTRGTMINRGRRTKSQASKRTYPLSDEQVEMFVHLKNSEEEYRRLFGKHYYENEYVFKNPNGKPYYPDSPTKAFRRIIIKHPELSQGVTFHNLRTSCVSILVHEGYDVKSIQKWVGHENYDTTLKIYAKVKDKEAKQEILEGMQDLIKIKKYNIQDKDSKDKKD